MELCNGAVPGRCEDAGLRVWRARRARRAPGGRSTLPGRSSALARRGSRPARRGTRLAGGGTGQPGGGAGPARRRAGAAGRDRRGPVSPVPGRRTRAPRRAGRRLGRSAPNRARARGRRASRGGRGLRPTAARWICDWCRRRCRRRGTPLRLGPAERRAGPGVARDLPADRAGHAGHLPLRRPREISGRGEPTGQTEHSDRCGDRHREPAQSATSGALDADPARTSVLLGERGLHRREMRRPHLGARSDTQLIAPDAELFAHRSGSDHEVFVARHGHH